MPLIKPEPRILDRSTAREVKCRGCGATILAFRDTQELSHEPPECAWFLRLLQAEADNVGPPQQVEISGWSPCCGACGKPLPSGPGQYVANCPSCGAAWDGSEQPWKDDSAGLALQVN